MNNRIVATPACLAQRDPASNKAELSPVVIGHAWHERRRGWRPPSGDAEHAPPNLKLLLTLSANGAPIKWKPLGGHLAGGTGGGAGIKNNLSVLGTFARISALHLRN